MDRETFYKGLLQQLNGSFVEVGTCWGGFADFLTRNTNCKVLYCIDPYKVFPQHTYIDALNFTTQEELDKKYAMVCDRLSQTSKVVMVRKTSYEGRFDVPDELDFVYIDGNHHYNEVLKDLVIWWPKVRKGGYLCGDDVEPINVPHQDGDVLVQHQAGSFGVYGVATALRDFKNVCKDFDYTVVANQFIALKK